MGPRPITTHLTNEQETTMAHRIPPNGTRVRMGERHGKVSRTGHPPGGVIVEVKWDDDNTLTWYKADELTIGE
jgi:hypothetical protein